LTWGIWKFYSDAGPLDGGDFFDHCVECPRHGARFDVRTGAVLRMPAVTPVESYYVDVEGEDVYIWTAD
jgi:3-phenylpropionate/trans-cinnamate dioxygenase ferredoxin subunit